KRSEASVVEHEILRDARDDGCCTMHPRSFAFIRVHLRFNEEIQEKPMSTITASMVNELRAKTGQGMMECKKALQESGGDVDKAVEYFRKKGVKSSITERSASEGRVAVGTTPDKRIGAIAMINCNTDFTAKSAPVQNILNLAVQKLLANSSS